MIRWVITAALCLMAVPAQTQPTDDDPCAIPRSLTRTRPNPEGEPVRVEMGIFLIDVIEVNEVEESFTVDFALTLSWRDPRLATTVRGTSLEDCQLTLAEIWHPQIGLVNQRDLAVAQDVDVDIAEDGTVRFGQRLTGALSSPLDLQRFPFDTQSLRIQIASFEYGPEDVLFVVQEGREGLEGIVVPGWYMVESVTDASVAPMLSSVGEHARLDHIITVKRHTPYYFWKFIIPLIFIVFMAWTVLWLDPTDFRPGIGVATASVFSLIAFLLGLRQMTPKVPYLTQMDELVLAVTSLVFLTLGEVVFISRLVRRERIETARRVDRYSRWIFLTALVVVLASFFLG